MSDTAAATRTSETSLSRLESRRLTPDEIELVLTDFRTWLAELTASTVQETIPEAPFDLSTLTAQIVALRHEVNLQTKACRALLEQATELVKTQSCNSATNPSQEPNPPIQVLIEIADALLSSANQVEQLQKSLANHQTMSQPQPVGWLARFWQRSRRQQTDSETTPRLSELIARMGEGYTISLRRLERALAQLGLTPIDCVGKPYDPELMAALSTVNDSKHPQGYVVNEVRRGYLRNGQLFRCAEVIVAR